MIERPGFLFLADIGFGNRDSFEYTDHLPWGLKMISDTCNILFGLSDSSV